MSSEKRRMPRFRKRAPVEYRTKEGVTLKGFTSDVGPGGLAVVSQRVLDEGTPVDVEIEMPSGERVCVSAQVTWARRVPRAMQRVEKNGFGLMLTSAPTEAWFRLLTDLAA